MDINLHTIVDLLALPVHGPGSLGPGFLAYALAFSAALGLVMGSFINCWAWRYINGESIAHGRSHCTSCGHELGARDLVPLFSWLATRGRCRYCGARVSARYPLAELVCGLAFVAVTWAYGVGPQQLELLVLCCVLLFLSLTDLDAQLIPNASLLVAVVVRVAYLGLCYSLGVASAADVGYYLLSALVVGAVLLVTVLVCDRVLGRESMGGGDLKLFAVAALYVGWQQSVLLVFVSCVLGLVLGEVVWPRVVRAAEPAERDEPAEHDEPLPKGAFPFGPAIALALLLTLLVGTNAVNWYLGLF